MAFFHPIEGSLSLGPSFDSFAMDDDDDCSLFPHRESRSEPMNNIITGSIFRTGAEHDTNESERAKHLFELESCCSERSDEVNPYVSIVSDQVFDSICHPSVMHANPITSAACSPAHDCTDCYCELEGVDETDNFDPYPYDSYKQNDGEMNYQDVALYLSSWGDYTSDAFAAETRQESGEFNEQMLKPGASRVVDYNAFFKVGRSSSMSAVMLCNEAESSKEHEDCITFGKSNVRRHTIVIPTHKPTQTQRLQPIYQPNDNDALKLCINSDAKCNQKHAVIHGCQVEYTTLQRGKPSFLDIDEVPASSNSFSSHPQWE